MDSNVRRLIPMVSTLSLTAAACGGEVAGSPDGVLGAREGGTGTTMSGGSVDISGGASTQSVFTQLCQKQMACDPSYFEEVFSSAAECAAYYEDYVGGYLAQLPTSCQNALLSYLQCFVGNTQCVTYDGESYLEPGGGCESFAPSIVSACGVELSEVEEIISDFL